MRKEIIPKSVFIGLLASTVLFAFYFTVLALLSGWSFVLTQFLTFWYFIVSLALGFGIQVGLYTYLRSLVNRLNNNAGKVVSISGATSTVAMVSCCSHYLVNILPIIGVTGFITLVSQYQIELFWLGILANLLGITYMIRKLKGLGKVLSA